MAKAQTASDIFAKYQQDPSIAKKAQSWFNKQAVELNRARIQPNKLMRAGSAADAQLKNRVVPGKLYMFFYEAKGKDDLPYFDQFPLVFPFDRDATGFIGLNMHYLPYILRVRLLDRLLTYSTNTKMDQTTRLKFQWATISAASRLALAKPCVHRYLISHVKSQFLEVDASQWFTAMMLPVERFSGASKQAVWADSFGRV